MILISDILSLVPACDPQYTRNYSSYNISTFQELLSYERWDDVLVSDDVNNIFNSFLDTYLKIFHSCFIKKKITPKSKCNPWRTHGIRISCKRKSELCLRQDNDPNLKLYYRKYCKTLAKVIKEARKYITIVLS
jgi:hypothetical protein